MQKFPCINSIHFVNLLLLKYSFRDLVRSSKYLNKGNLIGINPYKKFNLETIFYKKWLFLIIFWSIGLVNTSHLLSDNICSQQGMDNCIFLDEFGCIKCIITSRTLDVSFRF